MAKTGIRDKLCTARAIFGHRVRNARNFQFDAGSPTVATPM